MTESMSMGAGEMNSMVKAFVFVFNRNRIKYLLIELQRIVDESKTCVCVCVCGIYVLERNVIIRRKQKQRSAGDEPNTTLRWTNKTTIGR